MIRSLLIALIPVAALTANTMAGTKDLAKSTEGKVQAMNNAFADSLLAGPSMTELRGRGNGFRMGGNFCRPSYNQSYCAPSTYCAPTYCPPTYCPPTYCEPYVQPYCPPVSCDYTQYCYSQPAPCYTQPAPCYTPCYTDYCSFNYCEPVAYCPPTYCPPTYCAPTYSQASYCAPSNYCFPKNHCAPVAFRGGKNFRR